MQQYEYCVSALVLGSVNSHAMNMKHDYKRNASNHWMDDQAHYKSNITQRFIKGRGNIIIPKFLP